MTYNYDDPAHEADMRALRKEQLEADCGGEMADDYDDESWKYDDEEWIAEHNGYPENEPFEWDLIGDCVFP